SWESHKSGGETRL
nr:Chain B, C-terminal motif from Glycoprotein [synthetic construct]3NFK_C Chain C, Glycoprotein G [Lyssavirus rabies]3NFK_D Chain D, Glycoprotein G [Lyssavirus rabies]